MKYEELSYRRMLQIVQSSRIARLAAVRDGAPYVVPVCVHSRMDGCIPVFEVRADNDGDLLAALASNAAVMLEFETPGRSGAVETVLVRGRAAVEQNVLPCGCTRHGWQEEYPHAKTDRRKEEPWQQNGRVRFDAWTEPAGESCACAWKENGCGCRTGGSCPLGGWRDTGGCTCTRCTAADRCDVADCCERRNNGCQNSANGQNGQNSCSCTYSCGGAQEHTAVITVVAAEMTGRSVQQLCCCT